MGKRIEGHASSCEAHGNGDPFKGSKADALAQGYRWCHGCNQWRK